MCEIRFKTGYMMTARKTMFLASCPLKGGLFLSEKYQIKFNYDTQQNHQASFHHYFYIRIIKFLKHYFYQRLIFFFQSLYPCVSISRASLCFKLGNGSNCFSCGRINHLDYSNHTLLCPQSFLAWLSDQNITSLDSG